MGYTQPISYSDGTELATATLVTNEESLKVYINQEITEADIGGLQMDRSDVALGRYNPIENSYSFETSDIVGQHKLASFTERSYATSTTKNNAQTELADWQDMTNSGVRVVVKEGGSAVMVNWHCAYKVEDNNAPASSEGPGSGKWWNKIILSYTRMSDGKRFLISNTTNNYTFQDNGSATETEDPGSGFQQASRRSIMGTQIIPNLPIGTYNFTLTVDPHNETGFAAVKNMTAEVFYV